MTETILQQTQLGKETTYNKIYDFNLLQSLPRKAFRETLQMGENKLFTGVDVWNAYELSWLNLHGKPQVAMAEFRVDADSANLIESKALKLYLNAFSQTRFNNAEEVRVTLQEDLSQAAVGKVEVKLFTPDSVDAPRFADLPGTCLDNLDVEIKSYQHDASHLTTEEKAITETVHTHLFKSNCPVTSQPDWASIVVRYTGKKISHESLLKYLISFREHSEFHEQCVERIFADIMQHCAPEKLTVYARYTRRGGLDINPFRSNFESEPENLRTSRQ